MEEASRQKICPNRSMSAGLWDTEEGFRKVVAFELDLYIRVKSLLGGERRKALQAEKNKKGRGVQILGNYSEISLLWDLGQPPFTFLVLLPQNNQCAGLALFFLLGLLHLSSCQPVCNSFHASRHSHIQLFSDDSPTV